MDPERFSEACRQVLDTERKKSGIGSLGEKTLHAILKRYFEPDETKHEVKIGAYIADIANQNGITEIQTRQFYKLRDKLADFLEIAEVTVVFPVAGTKWLSWIDEETGEAGGRRKSPKTGRPYEIFHELYQLKPLLTNSGLKFCIPVLQIEEYRLLNGWSRDKKKGSTRYDRIPVGMEYEVRIDGPSDYSLFPGSWEHALPRRILKRRPDCRRKRRKPR